MRSTDTLLDYVLRFMEAQNKVSDMRITPLVALKIYNEIVRAKSAYTVTRANVYSYDGYRIQL